jgi:hypothetical protein
MTLNFPDTPGNGEKYLAENGIEYTYNLANDTWTGALSAQNVPINPSPSDVSVDPPFGNPSGTNPGSGTLADPFIITDSIVPTLNGSTESLQTITITSGKAGDQVVFTNNTTPLDISSKYTQPLGYIDANGKWIGKLVYNDSFGADTTANTTYTGKLQCGTGTVYFQWNVQQQATPAMFVTAGTALTGTPVSGTDLGATQPTVTGGLSPYTYSYKWQTSDDNIAFTDIPSAITSSYSLTSANVGKYIRCIATVSDSSTIQAVTVSSTTATVNVVSIDVSLSTNQPQVNQPITATAVVLGGVAPVSTAYQWKADGVNIIGATSATYVVEVATDGKRLSCQITTTDAANTNAVKTSTQTNPVASGDVPEINTVTLTEVTPDSPDRFTDQSFTVAVDMTKDQPKSDYAIRGKVLGDLTVDVETSVITKLEEEAVSGAWTAGTLAEDNAMVSVAYGAGKFVAVSQNGTNRLQYSADGINWTAVSLESISTTAQWVSVVYGNGYFLAINSNGTNRGATSIDGINWTVVTDMPVQSYTGLTFGGTRWVAITSSVSNKIAYSATADPTGSWSNSNVPSGGTGNNWSSVAYGGGKYVAVSSGTGTGTNRVMYSSDGQNWTSTTSAVQNQWKSITYGDGKFVAVGAAGTPDQVMYSTDGINWTSTASSSPSNWTAVTYGKGKFLAVAGSDTIRVMYSTDGISWTSMTSGTPDGAWKSVVYGGDKFVSVASGAVMWSYTGTGTAGTESVLTLTDTTGLSSINQGDTVVQNSGGTPVTTAITNVTNTPINKTQAYVFTGTPSNLADVLANGTLVTTENTWNSSQCLVLVNNAGNTIPDMTSVFSANGDTSFYIGLGESYGNPTNGGSFKADGTRLGGSGGYNNTEWILMKYTDIANEGNYDSSYRIYDDAEVAYTVIGYYNANSNITFGTIEDVGTVSRPTLTLTDDTNLANFRVGDAVQQAIGVTYIATRPPEVIGDPFLQTSSKISTYVGSEANSITFTYPAPVDFSTINKWSGGSYSINVPYTIEFTDQNGSVVSGTTTTTSGYAVSTLPVTPPTQVKSFKITGDDGYAFLGFYDNSGTFVATGELAADAIKVTAINEATPSITTDGGSWSGTDGTAAGPNTSYNWSTAGTVTGDGAQYISNAFDGNLDTNWYGPSTYTFPATVVGTKYEIDFHVSLSSSGFFINDTSPASVGIDTPVGHYLLDITALCPSGLDKITINFVNSIASQYISAIYVDGRLLLDSSDATVTPESFVTGPTQAAASGTVKTSGSREVTAPIQTSTITNVADTLIVGDAYNNSGFFRDMGTFWQNSTTNLDNLSRPGTTCVMTGGKLYVNPGDVIGIQCGTDQPGGAALTINIALNSDDSTTSYPSGTAPDLGNNNAGNFGSYTLQTFTYTGAPGYVVSWLFAGSSGNGAGQSGFYKNGTKVTGNSERPVIELALTDDTDLALFTPGDVVQGGGTLNTTATATAWQGSQSATTVAQVISVGGNLDTNYSGNYVWSTLVFSPPLQGNEFKFYVEAGCTVRNDSNNQVATTSTTGDLLVPDDGTGLLSSVSISVNGSQGGVTGPYVDGVLATNVVEVDTLIATASYGIPVSAKVVSTNLATPSITTDGGNWIGTDGTGLNGKGGILNEFMSQNTFVSTTNASTLTYNQSLPGSLPATQAMVFRDGVTNIDVTYAFHVYSSTDGINWTRVANKVNEPQTWSAPYLAVASDDQAAGTGTVTGSAATGEDKVTGPVKTKEVAGPYLTLSPSSGRWLVTETGYSALLKLNKFAKSSSVQSVASLFTVMDGLGNVTDLTTEDPGYTNMVGDPTYTLTFPSVFPSGETPDVELPPGTKYQVEVKATNDIGVDNAFSNDVMPVAGLLQTSVITASEEISLLNITNNIMNNSGSAIVADPNADKLVIACPMFDGSEVNRSQELGGANYTVTFGSDQSFTTCPAAGPYGVGTYAYNPGATTTQNSGVTLIPQALLESAWNDGTESFTLEGWFYGDPAGDNNTSDAMFSRYFGSGASVLLNILGSGDSTQFLWSYMEGDGLAKSYSFLDKNAPVQGRWNHYAFSFDGPNSIMYQSQNGVVVAAALTTPANWKGLGEPISSQPDMDLLLGGYSGGTNAGKYTPGGWWSDVRVYKGLCKYTAGFAAGRTTLTTTDNTNYNLFSAGDAVVESSGGTPVTSAITNVGTTPWPLWNNAALNWSVTGTKTSYGNGGDVVTSALPTGSLLYTEFTIVGTSVQKQLGVQFTTTPNSAYDNNIVGWYFNGAGGSKAVWLAGGDSNSSMGDGMGGAGGALYTKADYDAGGTTGSSYGGGDVLGYAIDLDGNVWVSKNGGYLATAGWYAAGNAAPVPGVSGNVATITGTTRYFGAQYNGGQTFTISATGTYTPLQTLLTFTNDTNLANFRVGDVIQNDNTSWNQSTIWSQTSSMSNTVGDTSQWLLNLFNGNPGSIAPNVDYVEIPNVDITGVTSINVKSNGSGNISVFVNTVNIGSIATDSNAVERSISWDGSAINTLRLSGTSTQDMYYISFTTGTGDRMLVDGNVLPEGTSEFKVTGINEATPSISTNGGVWSGTDGTGSPGTWNQSQVWSNYFTTPPSIAGTQTRAFDGTLGMQGGYWTGVCKWEPTTPITYYDKVEVYDGIGQRYHTNDEAGYSDATPNTWMLLRANSNGASGDVLTSIEIERPGDDNEVHTMSGLRIDGRLYVDTGVSGAPTTEETFVTGSTFPAATGTISAVDSTNSKITFSETTGRWLVTQSDYDAAKKLDTKVVLPLVLDASNTAHVALFNAMNTKFTAFPTARQTFIDALRTKIIGLTLTTPELEVLCGTAKTLVKRHEITIVGNKFYIDGVLQATLSLKKGTTYIFDQDEATNSGHTLKLYTDANKTTEYTSGVTVIGTPGGATSRTTFVVPSNAPAVLYYQSTAAASMGGQLNIS